VRAMTRNPDRYEGAGTAVRGDVSEPSSLIGALEGQEAAYYLVHSLDAADFSDRDRKGAEAFAEAARAAGVGQVIYLGGLGDEDDDLSEHLLSRREVEGILRERVPTTVLRAGIVIGDGGISWEILRQLVARLPVMVTPRWVQTRTQPVALEDALAASRAVGVDWLHPTGFGTHSDFTALHVLEDTPTLHHVVVCTLCSCYPRPILGNSPEWYRTPNYRRRIVRSPRQVLAEFGLHLPADVEVRVEDSNQKHRFLVLPVRPDGTEGWTEDQLTEIVTRDCLIGVALPRPGVTTDAVTRTRPAIHPVPE